MTVKHDEFRQPGTLLFQKLKPLAHSLLDLIFPPTCIHCGRVDTAFCDDCFEELSAVPVLIYKQHINDLDGSAATQIHDGILQAAVQALKYQRRKDLALPLAKRLNQALEQLDWTFDIIVPVPMHTQRLKERGYNQAKEISLALSALVECPQIDGIHRIRATRSQVGLNREERLQNVIGAFEADGSLISGRSVLLVDDVHTTGATLIGCAAAAYQAGAKAVYGMSVTAARI